MQKQLKVCLQPASAVLLIYIMTSLDPTTLQLTHQPPSPNGRGLSDALQQYGVLRSHSITQDARIRMEQRKLQHIEKRVEEEKQKQALLDDRLRALKTMLDDKASTAMQLERDIANGSHLAQCLELRSMSSDFPEEISPYEDAGERENLAHRQIDKASAAAEKMRCAEASHTTPPPPHPTPRRSKPPTCHRKAKESESRPALEDLLKRDGSKLKAYIDAASSLAHMIKQLQGSSSESSLSISHTLHDALAAHVSGARVSSLSCVPTPWLALLTYVCARAAPRRGADARAAGRRRARPPHAVAADSQGSHTTQRHRRFRRRPQRLPGRDDLDVPHGRDRR